MNGILDDFKNAFRRKNNGLIQIILLNVSVFLALIVLRVVLTLAGASLDASTGKPVIYEFILEQLVLPSAPDRLLYKPWTLFTYFFSHEGIFHLLFNMLFLYWFGKLIDEYLGNRRLVNLYLLGGLMGGLLYVAMYNLLPYFAGQVDSSTLIGASGAVFAVVVGAATLMPNYTFHLLLLGPVRIKYIAAFYVVLSFAQSIGDNAGGAIAHLGGALLGFVFITQLRRGNDLGKPLTVISEWFGRLFRKKPVMRVTYQNKAKSTYSGYANPNPGYSIPNQDEIDNILDKISRSGYESLTREEKQKLFRASQRKE
ncbi:MAG: rhomboid family intramembrane serine protease [Ferruginibacter sp.]|nr:rhomboid family intramembrane serine protease [Cytophagales bacterium]